MRRFGGNSGYVNYSKSRRAVEAENRDLRSKSQMDKSFADEVNEIIRESFPDFKGVSLKKIKDSLTNISADEWHHTSMYGNRTNYYSAETIADYFMPETEEEKQRKEELERLRKEIAVLREEIRDEVYDKIPSEFIDSMYSQGRYFRTSDGNLVWHSGDVFSQTTKYNIHLIPKGENFEVSNFEEWSDEHEDVLNKSAEEYNAVKKSAIDSIPQEKKDNLYELIRKYNALQRGLPTVGNGKTEAAEATIDTANVNLPEKTVNPNETNHMKEDLNEKPIQGLEAYSQKEILEDVRNHFNEMLEYSGIDAEIIGMRIVGSRANGNATAESDLDVLLEFKGSIKEDSLFNILNDPDEKLLIGNIPVDINPINAKESGTISEWMERNKDYVKEGFQEETTMASEPSLAKDANLDAEIISLLKSESVNFMELNGKPLRIVNDNFGSDPNYVIPEEAYINEIRVKDGKIAIDGNIDNDGVPVHVSSLGDLNFQGVENLTREIREMVESKQLVDSLQAIASAYSQASLADSPIMLPNPVTISYVDAKDKLVTEQLNVAIVENADSIMLYANMEDAKRQFNPYSLLDLERPKMNVVIDDLKEIAAQPSAKEKIDHAETKPNHARGIDPEAEIISLLKGESVDFTKLRGKPLRIVNDAWDSDPSIMKPDYAYIRTVGVKDNHVTLVGALSIGGEPMGISDLSYLHPQGVMNLVAEVRKTMEAINAERLDQNNRFTNQSTIMTKQNQSVSQQTADQQKAEANAGKKVDTRGLGNEAKTIMNLNAVAEKAKSTMNMPYPEQSVFLIRRRDPETKKTIYQAFGEDARRLSEATNGKVALSTPVLKGQELQIAKVESKNAKEVADMLAKANVSVTVFNGKGLLVNDDKAFSLDRPVGETKRPERGVEINPLVTSELKAALPKIDAIKRESNEMVVIRKPTGVQEGTFNYVVAGKNIEKLQDAISKSGIGESAKNQLLTRIGEVNGTKSFVVNNASPADNQLLGNLKTALIDAGIKPVVYNTRLEKANDPIIVPTKEERATRERENLYAERAERHSAEKANSAGAMVFLKMSDGKGQSFYQTFGEDAQKASAILGKEKKDIAHGANFISYVSLSQQDLDKVSAALEKAQEKKPVIVEFINKIVEKVKEAFDPELKAQNKMQFDIAKNLHANGIYDIQLIVDGNKVAAHHLSKEDRDAYFKKEIAPKDLVAKYFEKELAGQTPDVTRVNSKKESQDNVLMETVNGQKVTNARTFTSEKGNHFFAANLDGVALRPQVIDEATKQRFDSKQVSVQEMMQQFYPTKLMPKVPTEEFRDNKLSNGKEFSFFKISKDENPESKTAGKYVLEAVVDGKRLQPTPVSYRNLNEFFDGVTPKAKILERTMGEQLHLPAGYEKYKMPEGAKIGENVNVKIQRDDAQRRHFISAEAGGRELGKKMMSYDDVMSYRSKAATKEQLGAKYFSPEIKTSLGNNESVAQKKSKSHSMAI